MLHARLDAIKRALHQDLLETLQIRDVADCLLFIPRFMRELCAKTPKKDVYDDYYTMTRCSYHS